MVVVPTVGINTAVTICNQAQSAVTRFGAVKGFLPFSGFRTIELSIRESDFGPIFNITLAIKIVACGDNGTVRH